MRRQKGAADTKGRLLLFIRPGYREYEKEKWIQRLHCFPRYIIIEFIYCLLVMY